MPVNIKMKSALKCNSGKLSTNKYRTLVIDSTRVVERYLDKTVIVLKPIIDNMIIRYRFEDFPEEEKEELQDQIRSYLVQQVTSGENKYVDISQSDSKKSKYRGYKQNIWLYHSLSDAKTLIQTDPKKDKDGKVTRPYLKLWINPDEMGLKGVMELRQIIKDMTIQTLTLDQILSHNKCIEQMDVAIDILGIGPEDLDIRGEEDHVGKSMMVANPMGRKQTHYVDFKAGKTTRTYMYDKRAELKDNGLEPMYKGVLHTRVEHRVKTDVTALKLLKLKNHFKKLRIWAMDYSALKFNYDFTHILFIQYALTRTLGKALDLVPKEKRFEYQKAYLKAQTNIWEPDKIWKKYWPQTLKASGLLPLEED